MALYIKNAITDAWLAGYRMRQPDAIFCWFYWYRKGFWCLL